jgi:hypothetical protein
MTTPQIDELLAEGRVIAEGKLAPEEIAKRLGTIQTTAGGTIYLQPRDANYSAATVTFDVAKKRVNGASLDVAPQGRVPTMAELKARFGEPVRGAVTHFAAPVGFSFTMDFGDFDRNLKIIAYVPNSEAAPDQWRIENISLIAEMRSR